MPLSPSAKSAKRTPHDSLRPPNHSQDDIDTVVSVLQSDFLTQGPQVPTFEGSLKSYCGAAHAVAVNSATSALHIACSRSA